MGFFSFMGHRIGSAILAILCIFFIFSWSFSQGTIAVIYFILAVLSGTSSAYFLNTHH